MDAEDYYFPKDNRDYDDAMTRTREEVIRLLLEDLKTHRNFVFASVKGNYGEEAMSMFTCAVWVRVPKEIRVNRVRERSYEKFGDRILQGGDLYEKENSFFEMVERRSEKDVEAWLDSAGIPILEVDGTQPTEKNVQIIKGFLWRQGKENNADGFSEVY